MRRPFSFLNFRVIRFFLSKFFLARLLIIRCNETPVGLKMQFMISASSASGTLAMLDSVDVSFYVAVSKKKPFRIRQEA